MDYYNLTPQDFLIILDDVELPLGSLRLRPQGSSGGHKGLQSIIDYCGTDTFPRLRLGVGRPEMPIDLANYVLMPFKKEEESVVNTMIQNAGSAVKSWILNGIEITMNRFNKKENTNNKKGEDYGEQK